MTVSETITIALYFAAAVAAAVGAFNQRFDANLAQRFALGAYAIWVAWRTTHIWRYGHAWPHEPVLAATAALYALGTVVKTVSYGRSATRRDRRTEDVR